MAPPPPACPPCAAGYCDTELSVCVCVPGWRGEACETPYLSFCRTAVDSLIMACDGFTGVMSCACRQQCIDAFGVASVAKKPCFEVLERLSNSSADVVPVPTISDLPSENALVRFWMAEHTRSPEGFNKAFFSRRLYTAHTPALRASSPTPPFKRARQLVPSSIAILPNHRCPVACGGSGTCVRSTACNIQRVSNVQGSTSRFHGAGCARGQPRCLCHKGMVGKSCETDAVPSACLHGCSGHGRCVSRMCLCDRGFSGFDCSLSALAPAARQDDQLRISKSFGAPTFVYTMPGYLGTHALYQGRGGGAGGWEARGVFAANIVFIERALRRGHLLSGPRGAALFVVPLLLSQVHSTATPY
jgi:hypothetical protein